MLNWTPAKDVFPPSNIDILVLGYGNHGSQCWVCQWKTGPSEWWVTFEGITLHGEVTHWMHLPDLPNENAHQGQSD